MKSIILYISRLMLLNISLVFKNYIGWSHRFQSNELDLPTDFLRSLTRRMPRVEQKLLPPGAPEFIPFLWNSCCSIFSFLQLFFVDHCLSFLSWTLSCLSICHLLITPLFWYQQTFALILCMTLYWSVLRTVYLFQWSIVKKNEIMNGKWKRWHLAITFI